MLPAAVDWKLHTKCFGTNTNLAGDQRASTARSITALQGAVSLNMATPALDAGPQALFDKTNSSALLRGCQLLTRGQQQQPARLRPIATTQHASPGPDISRPVRQNAGALSCWPARPCLGRRALEHLSVPQHRWQPGLGRTVSCLRSVTALHHLPLEHYCWQPRLGCRKRCLSAHRSATAMS